ncbi:Reticulon-like protein B16, partial [Mucuna pruriens]
CWCSIVEERRWSKINNALLIAHDITTGKDFRIFFKEFSSQSFREVYIFVASKTRLSMISFRRIKYGDYVEKCYGVIHHQFSKHYTMVDESYFNKLSGNISKDKRVLYEN